MASQQLSVEMLLSVFRSNSLMIDETMLRQISNANVADSFGTVIQALNQALQQQTQAQQAQLAQQLMRVMGCHNRFCGYQGPQLKTVPSKGKQGKNHIQLCSKCYEIYRLKDYCQYCEQIYAVEYNDQDDKEWIACDQCQKWIHMDCEALYNPAFHREQEEYICPECRSKKKKNSKENSKRIQQTQNNESINDSYIYDGAFNRKINRKPIQAQELEYIPKKVTNRAQPSLGLPTVVLQVSKEGKTQFNYKLQLTDEEMKLDIEAIKEEITNERNRQLSDANQNSITETKSNVEDNQTPPQVSKCVTRSAHRENTLLKAEQGRGKALMSTRSKNGKGN